MRVGLVGAGPWAEMVHAPLYAAGPETTLAGVWARRLQAAQRLASTHGATAFETLDALFDACDVVVFCVPPAVQADLARHAARSGRGVVLEKPIAADLEGAERLADAIGETGVASMVVLTWRFARDVRAFLDGASTFGAFAGRGAFLGGGMLDGPFRTPWRLESGPLLDLGPHVIDLLDAALGPVVDVRASGRSDRWVSLDLEHEGGAVSQAALCAHTLLESPRAGVELFGEAGTISVDTAAAVRAGTFRAVRSEAAALAAPGPPHPLDVRRGLHLQRILEAATNQLG